MLRKRAIRSLLVEEIAGLRLPRSDDDRDEAPGEASETAGDGRAAVARDPSEAAALEAEVQREALEKSERRALVAVGIDWLALVVLFLFRDPAAPFLPAGPTIETVFTLGVVAVAVHSGFRLGQLEKIRAARRAWDRME